MSDLYKNVHLLLKMSDKIDKVWSDLGHMVKYVRRCTCVGLQNGKSTVGF